MNTPPTDLPNDPGLEPELADTSAHVAGSQQRRDVDLGFLQPSTNSNSLGRLGHYEVLELLGRGGFGIVLKAFDEVLQRVVALKVLAPDIAATSPARKRFLREARAAAQVRHENALQVYDIEETPLPYLAMEYIPGESLQHRMDTVGPLSHDEAVRIGIQIARALAAAHEMGLIHRDVKPGNVLLEDGIESRAKLTDFGLARAADDASLTQSGIVAGTPQYMAPEQARGEPIDHRADLFSLGTMLYAMVSGRLPFRAGNSVAILKRICDDTPRPIRDIIPEVPQWLCDVIGKLHAKDREKRFQSAREVVEALTRHEAPPPVGPAISQRLNRTRILAGGVILVLLGLLAAALIYGATRNGDTEPLAHPNTQPAKAVNASPPSANWALKFEDKERQVWSQTLAHDQDTPVTLEGWFNMPGSPPTFRTVLALGGNDAVWIAHSPDTIAPLSLRLPVNSFPLGAKIPFGKWTHVALVYDQRETRFYLDGKLQSASLRLDLPSKHPRWSAAGLIIGSTRYVINGQASFGGYFVGQLDEIRLSKTARYAEGFTPQRRFQADDDTLALYHCDEGAGQVLIDASGNGHDAMVSGSGLSWVEVGL